jgi:hypothetical protein
VIEVQKRKGCRERGCPFPPTATGLCREHQREQPTDRPPRTLPAITGTPAERAATALLRNPERSNRDIAAAAGVSHITVRRLRLELETSGEISVYRASPVTARTQASDSPGQIARAMLRADADQPNPVIAAAAGCRPALVYEIRRELEAAGEISVCRWHRFGRRQDRA